MTTWNPSDKSANVVLSNGNLTAATTSTNSADQGVRSTTSKSSGKFYFEVSFPGPAPFGADTGAGLTIASTILTSVGSSVANSIIAYGPTGNIYYNGSNTSISIGAAAIGDVAGFALDLANQRVWVRRNGGNWNNSGTANPAANVGGINISAVFTSNAAYALYCCNSNNASGPYTTNFGATTFAFAAPSGFSGWDPLATPPVELAGDLAPVVSFTAALGTIVSLTGNLGGPSSYGRFNYGIAHYSRTNAFEPVFLGDLDIHVSLVDLGGDIAPQIALGGALTVLFAPMAIAGDLSLNVVLGASSFDVGPLWAAVSPIPPPWTPSEPCPPSPWMTTAPCDPVVWNKSRLCNG